MQLSVCVIVRNAEKNIARCLEHLRAYDVELVVVDTGSTDCTREIALGYTANVYDFVWCDDFAAARNFAVSKASNNCVMMIDSDEYVETADFENICQFMEQNPNMVGRIQRRNVFTRGRQEQEVTEWINRIFSREKFCYNGRIHEQIVRRDGDDYRTHKLPVIVSHSGYDLPEEERRKKAQRNIRLLEEERKQLETSTDGVDAEKKDGQIPYVLYQLGKSYYMLGDYSKACNYFQMGLSYDLNPKLEYVTDMVETYGYALLNSGQAKTALFFENIYNTFGNSADFQFLMGLIYMNNALYEEAILEFQKAVEHKICRTKGVNSYLAYYNIGVIYECLGEMAAAKKWYKQCGAHSPAEERIRRIEEKGE